MGELRYEVTVKTEDLDDAALKTALRKAGLCTMIGTFVDCRVTRSVALQELKFESTVKEVRNERPGVDPQPDS